MKGYQRRHFQQVFRRPMIQRLLLAALVALLYIPTLPYPFVSDDIALVQALPMMRFGDFLNTTYALHLSTLIHAGLYHMIGIAPWGFRLFTIGCHIGVVLLVYEIVRTIHTVHATHWTAFVIAAIVAVHPVAVESVIWISGGAYVMYTCCFLASFLLYIKKRYRWSVVWFVLSLLFSEKAMVLALVFPLYEYLYGTIRSHWKQWLPYVCMSGMFLLFYLTKLPVRLAMTTRNPGIPSSLYNPLIQVPLALISYGELMVWPRVLTFYHSEFVLSFYAIVLRCIAVCGALCLIVVGIWKKKQWTFWAGLFLIPLLPVLTPFRIAWLVAERYSYMSIIGFAGCIVFCFDYLVYRKYLTKSLVIVLSISIIVALFFRSSIRARDWETEDTLWIKTSHTAPSCPYTWNNMGDVYSRHHQYEEAKKSFSKAIMLDPQYTDAYYNLGETYRITGDQTTARILFQKAVTLNPQLWQGYVGIAATYVAGEEYENAKAIIDEGLRIVPQHPILMKNKQILGTYPPQ